MLKVLDLLEAFFERFVPSPLKRPYHIAFRYSVFVFGGLIGWVILDRTNILLLHLRLGENVHFLNLLWHGVAYSIGLILAIIFTFWYHRQVTFDVKTAWKERFSKFVPIQIFIAVLNLVLYLIATQFFSFPKTPASFVVTFFLSFVNFAFNKLLVFRKGASGKSL